MKTTSFWHNLPLVSNVLAAGPLLQTAQPTTFYSEADLAAGQTALPTAALYPRIPATAGDIIGKHIGAPLYDNISAAVRKIRQRFSPAATTMGASAQQFVGTATTTRQPITTIEIGAAAAASAVLVGCTTDGALTDALTHAILFKAIGGFGIFMLGLDLMKQGLHSVSGDTLEKIIGTLTRNRFASLAVGTGVTAVIQSSSVTTVTTLGLVDAGLMNLYQAMGVVIGANIGTTMTGWLFALKVAKYGLPIIGTSAIPYFFARSDKIKCIGCAAMGLGLVFLGLETMSAGFKNPAIKSYITDLFSSLNDPTYLGILKCMLAGAATTAIVQSSSATIGITMALAKAGAIPFEAAAALVLGENVGTTATALLASLKPNTVRTAKQVAYAHFLFNFTSAFVLVYPFSPLYIEGMKTLTERVGVDDPAAKIAFTHSFFNIAAAALFISVLPSFERLVKKLAPDRQPTGHGQRRLSDNLINSPMLALKASHGVISDDVNRRVEQMMKDLHDVLTGSKKLADIEPGMRMREEDLDAYQRTLYGYFNRIEQGGLTREAAAILDAQRHITGQAESMSDHLLKLFINQQQNTPPDLSAEAGNYLLMIHEGVLEHFLFVSHAIGKNEPEVWSQVKAQNDQLKSLIQEHEEHALTGSPSAQIFYRDMMALYRDILGNIKNMAQALAGKK